MFAAVSTALDRENAVLTDFQLRKVGLKAQNELDVIRKIVLAEAQRTALNVQVENEIIAQTTVRARSFCWWLGSWVANYLSFHQVIAGEEDRLIAIFQSEKQRNATVIEETAQAQAKATTIDSQSTSFSVLRQALGMSQDELLKYMWIKRLRELPADTKLLVGFSDAAITT